jgi:hypothetical protein
MCRFRQSATCLFSVEAGYKKLKRPPTRPQLGLQVSASEQAERLDESLRAAAPVLYPFNPASTPCI